MCTHAMYDYLIVGAGLFGAVFACEAKKRGKKCLVIDKRNHIAGNIYSEEQEGIQVHKYGAHIFHTNKKEVWDYVNQFATFNRYTNSPIAIYKEELYNLPFNMNTFYQLWGVKTPQEAKYMLNKQRAGVSVNEAKNLEERALQLVGRDIYEKLIKGYTEKQWGKRADELPAFIINRIPLRFQYDNNYFTDDFQGIPIGGYTRLIANMLEGIDIRLGQDFNSNSEQLQQQAKKIVYTGMIDEYYQYRFGTLEYRSLFFEEEVLDIENYQGNAVVNYTEKEIPYTRIIEHKHFEFGKQKKTVITKEYPKTWEKGMEPYYPVNDDTNMELFAQYKQLMQKEENVLFGGRLAEYQYINMDQVVERALACIEREFR